MKHERKIKLFLVDDDAVLMKLMEVEFVNHGGYSVETFPTGELCVQNLSRNPDFIILDYHLDGIQENAMNGLQTLDKIKNFSPQLPVIMLSSQDRIDVAINCMHHKASDYVVKSETAFHRLERLIPTILNYQKMSMQIDWYRDRMEENM